MSFGRNTPPASSAVSRSRPIARRKGCPDSTTETYVAMQLGIDNWRWADVPFYLRTGKAMTRRTTEIAIQFSGYRSRCSATRRSTP